MKTQSSIADQLARISRWGGHSVIRNLTPASMSRWLEQFRIGHYFNLVEAWDEIEERDDLIPGVVSKRKMTVSGCDWEIVQKEESAQAEAHAEALRELYENLTASDATELDLKGGMDLLIRQVMGAIGQKKAVHEIVWKPGSVFTAELLRVSLRHFENTTGRLRFSPNGTASGKDLAPGEWMVSATDLPPLMKATGIAYLYKSMPLRDWLTYCESNGLLYILFKTQADPGSEEWQKCETAVSQLAGIFGAVVSEGTEMERMGAASGELPYEKLIERMDRRIAALWRGADLGTISADNKGASVQQDESRLLLEHDCTFVSNQINCGLGLPYIQYRFGDGVAPLAELKVNMPMDVDEEKEQNKFSKAMEDGIEVSETQYRGTCGIRKPESKEDLLNLKKTEPEKPDDNKASENDDAADATAANERRLSETDPLAFAISESLTPFRNLVEAHLAEPNFDPDALLRDLQTQLPEIFSAMNADGQTEEALRDVLATEIVAGVLSAERLPS